MNPVPFAAHFFSSATKATTRRLRAITTNRNALLKWFGRSWPLLGVLAIFFVHLVAIFGFQLDAKITNRVVSLSCQLLGGGLVLYAINRNVGIVMGEDFYSILVNYLKEFPLRKRSVALEAQGGGYATAMGAMKPTVARHPKSIEEKIEYLQEQLINVRKDLEQESKERSTQIAGLYQRMDAKTQETELALRSIESKVKKTLGGVTEGVFGVLLMVYAAVTSAIP